ALAPKPAPYTTLFRSKAHTHTDKWHLRDPREPAQRVVLPLARGSTSGGRVVIAAIHFISTAKERPHDTLPHRLSTALRLVLDKIALVFRIAVSSLLDYTRDSFTIGW